jgi:tetratricopeptide (TPR) repeat protein/predicted Ser/Thr protein kinase
VRRRSNINELETRRDFAPRRVDHMIADNTWRRIEAIFTEALTLPEEQRVSFVNRHCGDDTSARDEVLRLLSTRAEMGDFLQAPIIDFTGQLFGPYRAVKEIGRGGMSVVYLGERIDRDFEKRVAIKVVLLQTPDPRRGETQILATLEHANVARLLDAGATNLGFRYLVMEYVEGTRCTDYCATLSEEQRLRLFLQVCAGVQFAHRSLVVHRDLKPDNILVTDNGTAKLLDFGIAKMLSPENTSPQTTGTRAFTADYASPEQILGQAVTTSADVYSLGVLLCELVGGRLPRTLSGLSLAELVASAQDGEVTEVPLRGDLAVIAQKAMRREAAERYESANAMARDVERYMEGMPVEARPPTWRYRASKFVARNRYAVGAAVLAVGALAVATGVAIWQARLAGMRFEQVRSLARSVMFDLHDAVHPLPGSLAARKLIVDRSLEYLDSLARDTSTSEEVQLDVARGYMRLANILGLDYEKASLGKSGEALARAEQAVAVARRLLASNAHSDAARAVLVDGLDQVASAHLVRGEAAKAIPLAKEATEHAERLLASTPSDRATKERLAAVTLQLAEAHLDNRLQKESLPLYARVVDLHKQVVTSYPGDQDALQHLARAHNHFSFALFDVDDLANAETHAREAYRIDRNLYDGGRKGVRGALAGDIGHLASLAGRAKRYEEEVRLYQEQLRLRREIAAQDSRDMVSALRVGATLDRLGHAYQKWGKYPEAIQFGEDALQQVRRIADADPSNHNANRELIYCLVDLANTYGKANRMDRRCALGSEAHQLLTGRLKALVPEVKRHGATAAEIAAACRK